MTGAEQIETILAQYRKHGWNLRRVLLCRSTADSLGLKAAAMFGEAEILAANFDAAWFSRFAADERETWELRSLSAAPFALIEVFEADDDEEIREETRNEMQTRMREQASKIGRQS